MVKALPSARADMVVSPHALVLAYKAPRKRPNPARATLKLAGRQRAVAVAR